MRRAMLLLALVAVLPGCQGVHFHDSVDMRFDFKPFDPLHPFDDGMHLPYVKGAHVSIFAWRDHDQLDLSNAVLESDDPGILDVGIQVSDDEHVWAQCIATDVGVTEVHVLKGSGDKGSHHVEVGIPDNVKLVFAGPYFIHTDPDEYEVKGTVNVLKGGTATFQVVYFQGSRRMYGAGVLETRPENGDITANPEATFFGEDREWVQVTPLTAGRHAVDLLVDGRVVGRLDVNAVEREDVEYIELRRESEKGAERDEWLAVLAIGYTIDNEPVYGIEYQWTVDGDTEPGKGDLYKYEYAPNRPKDLEAQYNGKVQKTVIHADDGYVWSTNKLGCAAGGRPDAAAAVLVLLGLAGLRAMRRRRAA